MNLVPEKSVHLVVTSPPYWQLKDYGTQNQIGYHENYECYINNLNLVWRECFRVLEDGCRMCVNIGDQFARAAYYGRYKVIPIRTEIIKFCESIGFDYMGAIIWQKRTTTNTTGGASFMGSFPTPRNGVLSIDYEFILIFRKSGTSPKVEKAIKDLSRLTVEEWKEYFSGHWNFGGTRQEGHLAMFPEELPKRLIKMFSFVGETILDPFMGSGTTSLTAKKLGRNSIGYEINAAYVDFAKRKLGINQIDILGTSYHFFHDEITLDIEKELEKLPYRFVDFHGIDKQVDPKGLQFGSRIDNNSTGKEKYYSVKQILSPILLRLNNDKLVRLIGVKAKESANDAAIQFLNDKTKGQKVFLKFDTPEHDENNNMLCYLYLKNKTFINAHLIKKGLADPDELQDFKYKKKFLLLANQLKE
jgi:modification methylase